MIGIILIFGWMLFLGFLAQWLGFDAAIIDLPESPDYDPDPGFFGFLGQAFDVAAFIGSAVLSFFKLMLFQIDEIWLWLNLIIFLMSLGVFYKGLRMIRGGG